MVLLSYALAEFYLFYDGTVDVQICALLTRSVKFLILRWKLWPVGLLFGILNLFLCLDLCFKWVHGCNSILGGAVSSKARVSWPCYQVKYGGPERQKTKIWYRKVRPSFSFFLHLSIGNFIFFFIIMHFIFLTRERRKDQTNKIQEDLTAERTVENKLM